MGWENSAQQQQGECDLRLIVTTPAGNLVDLNDPAVETDAAESWQFVRIRLPYQGEREGTWTAYAVRPQQIFTHGFVTDAYANMEEGIALVRNEIHRLCPEGCNKVLYYEDGSCTGQSAYREALNRELISGTFNSVQTANTAREFSDLLATVWDLIVFARQIDPTQQPFDQALADKLCQGQKALITDFYFGGAAVNPVLDCAGVRRGQNTNWNTIVGDGRLVSGQILLQNPGCPLYSYDLIPVMFGVVLAQNEFKEGSIVGTGTFCDDQNFFYSTLIRGFGRVEPVAVLPRVIVGQKILATFRMTESNRPIGDWDNVVANVTLQRPGGGPTETHPLYDDGTNGDSSIGNNYWSVEIPTPATSSGPHLLKADFQLTKAGCTVNRQAEYTIIVQDEPVDDCFQLTCHPELLGRRGQAVHAGLSCVRNLCLETDIFDVTVSDSKGWLCTTDPTGGFVPLQTAQIRTSQLDVGLGECLTELFPLFVCIPPDAQAGQSTSITYWVTSTNHPEQGPKVCTTEVRVTEPTCGDRNHPIADGDCNRDCHVDMFDLVCLAQSWMTWTAPEPEKPDLVPVSVPGFPPTEYCDLVVNPLNQQLSLKVTVRNQGFGNAGPTTTRITFPGFGLPVDVPTPPIPTGGTVTLPLVPVPLGCHDPNCDFEICVDVLDNEAEEDEMNNCVNGTCIG